MLAVERDVKPRNMNFAKEDRRGATNREGVLIRINTVQLVKFLHRILPANGKHVLTSPFDVWLGFEL